ncbi:transcription factor BIM2 [Malania oleifera]|uniref:transcription factor BIM2 n=1 Tax=Malania oleifera TaxID=397392 RepID=UPI0025AEAA00|nr:transcription factor BIM2 [Malania oleifera]XP_057961399.1 transcription factor BIM2 [Malania oleifera]XP_057961400.1 transcription factor BIM2 [Malania oleifera]
MMRSAKSHQEEEEDEEEEFGAKKEGPSNNKEVKSNDQKANAIRSKHSVTEQRRRSKINERFQILRDLIPHSDQKRDTASFLLEVIEYVQFLQEKVQKFEGSYQGWSAEPTKLMPWRNSHWRVQSLVGHPQAMKNGSGPGSTVSGKFDENNMNITPSMLANAQNPLDFDPSRDAAAKVMDQQPEIANKAIAITMPLQANMPAVQGDSMLVNPMQRPVSDAQSAECHINSNTLNQQEELMIEGGTINISSAYSQGLLSNLTQALQSAGVDLTQATISVQIDLGKRADRILTCGTSIARDHGNPPSSSRAMMHLRDASSGEDSDQAQKRLKT